MCFQGFTWARLPHYYEVKMIQVLESFRIVNPKLA